MAKPRSTTRAIVFNAEIVDSASLLRQDKPIAEKRIEEARRRLRKCISAYRGRVGEERDDELIASFRRPAEAVIAALAFQAAQKEANRHVHDDLRVQVRIGIASGDTVCDETTLTGSGVVLSQRLEHVAVPGAVVIHGAVYDALPEDLPIEYRDLGEHGFRDEDGAVHCYRVSLRDGAKLPSPRRLVLSWYLAAGLGIVLVVILALLVMQL